MDQFAYQVFYFSQDKEVLDIGQLIRESGSWFSVKYIVRTCIHITLQQETTVQPVLDFGSTIATIYRTASTGHTSVINIPYSCIHSIEFTVDTRMVYIQTNEVTGLDEVSLLAFLVSRKVSAYHEMHA